MYQKLFFIDSPKVLFKCIILFLLITNSLIDSMPRFSSEIKSIVLYIFMAQLKLLVLLLYS